LVNGADVNARDNTGETPLHDAASRGHKNVVECCWPVGEVNAEDNYGNTPLHWATYMRREGWQNYCASTAVANRTEFAVGFPAVRWK